MSCRCCCTTRLLRLISAMATSSSSTTSALLRDSKIVLWKINSNMTWIAQHLHQVFSAGRRQYSKPTLECSLQLDCCLEYNRLRVKKVLFKINSWDSWRSSRTLENTLRRRLVVKRVVMRFQCWAGGIVRAAANVMKGRFQQAGIIECRVVLGFVHGRIQW